MGLSRDDLQVLMDAFDASEWTEMVLTVNGTRVELTSTGRPPEAALRAPAADAALPSPAAAAAAGTAPAASAPARAAAAPPAEPPAEHHALHEVRAPSVGIFYRAPEPGAPPFVEEGSRVSSEDIVCIVEVMKLMNHVKAGVSGVVRRVHVDNATMIEHGQVLFTIEADG